MNKLIIFLVGLLGFASQTSAAVNLGSVSHTVAKGQTLEVQLGQSPVGRWFAPRLSNTNPNAAIVSTNGNKLVIQGITQGYATAVVCTEIQNDNCMSVNVTVTGSVLGEIVSSTHGAGSWVLSGSTVYYIAPNGVIPVPTWKIFLSNGGSSNKIVQANEADLSLPLLPLMILQDSRVK